MKLMHLSDLHLGKRLHEFSLHEDQAYILHEILSIAKSEKPDVVLIAGDLYDKPVPPTESVALLDHFLSDLVQLKTTVLIISGNHDSAERLSFGSRLMADSGVHMAPVYHGEISPLTLEDENGPVDFFLLPFVKPAHVRRFYPDESIESYTDALDCVIRHMPICRDRRSVLVTHQFVTGSARCDSEEINVGGTDNVDAQVFDPFDYVALGHLHAPQNISSSRIRYCGTPLKYSFSEANQTKSVTIVDMKAKDSIDVRTIPLIPLRNMIELRGTYMTLTSRDFYQDFDRSAYIHITLTDEDDVPDAAARLRTIYPNLMKIDYDNMRTRTEADFSSGAEAERDPLTLFDDFYQMQQGRPMSDIQRDYVARLLERLTEVDA